MEDQGVHNPLAAPLTKRWFVLRHGRSEANEKGIVASRLGHAEHAWGLVESGRKEVETSLREAADSLREETPLLLLMSPFLRTRQTAAIAEEILGTVPRADHRLGERDFGEYELLSDTHYDEVWSADPATPDEPPGKAESVYEVTRRVCDLVLEVERDPAVRTCLLVTHCDVAMILECAARKIDPRHHRTLDPVKTGEVRRLEQPFR